MRASAALDLALAVQRVHRVTRTSQIDSTASLISVLLAAGRPGTCRCCCSMPRVGLLRHDRADDHVAGPSLMPRSSPGTARATSERRAGEQHAVGRAGRRRCRRLAARTRCGPRRGCGTTSPRRPVGSGEHQQHLAVELRARSSSVAACLRLRLVERELVDRRRACRSAGASVERRAQRAALHLLVDAHARGSCGFGPCATPPPTHCGARIEPCRARPVPFWRHGFLPPPRTSPRVLVECVPARMARQAGDDHLVHQRHADRRLEHVGGQVARAGLVAGGVEDVDRGHRRAPFASAWRLDRRAHHHQAAVGTGDGAPDEQEVRARGRPGRPRGSARVMRWLPVLAGHPHALEHAGGRGARADRAGRAVLLARCRGCAPRPANPWRFMTPGEPLALGDADDVGLLAGREDVGGRAPGRACSWPASSVRSSTRWRAGSTAGACRSGPASAC